MKKTCAGVRAARLRAETSVADALSGTAPASRARLAAPVGLGSMGDKMHCEEALLNAKSKVI
jgi:hypothetical protein